MGILRTMRVKMKWKYVLLVLFAAILSNPLHAQNARFEQMKDAMDASSLPLVNLTFDTVKANRNSYVPATIEIADYYRRTDSASDTVILRCKIRYRGGTASTFKKKSFAVKLTDDAGDDLDANLFGIRKENSWILDAMAVDRIRMRNRVCFDIWNDMSHTPYDTKYGSRNGTKGVFVELFVNGGYNGLYCFTDKIDRKLLGLKKAKTDGDSVTIRGLLYKGINWQRGYDLRSYDTANVDADTWNAWELQYPDDYPSAKTWQPLMDLIDFCSDATPASTFHEQYADHFYYGNLVDYLTFVFALNVGDNVYKNTFLSVVDITKAKRFMLSPWDMDMSLGGNWNGKYDESLTSINKYNDRAPFNRLLVQNIGGFKDSVAGKWKEKMSTLFSVDSLSQRLDNYANLFRASGAWEREVAKWNGDPVPLKEDISEELDYVKDWYGKNYESLCKQFGIRSSIADVRTASPKHDGEIYTIDGRRLNVKTLRELKRGIYIINGKKLIVR